LFARFFGLVEEIENWNVMRADKAIRPFCQSSHCDFETMGLLRVQGPKNNILAVGEYLRADVPFEGKNDDFDSVPSSIERYVVQLNVENVLY
jgi:hypothetical protein